jgi:hypothetical protein
MLLPYSFYKDFKNKSLKFKNFRILILFPAGKNKENISQTCARSTQFFFNKILFRNLSKKCKEN